MTKKLLLTFALLLTAVTGAWADDSGTCGASVTYTYVDDTQTLTISGTGDMEDYTSISEQPWSGYRMVIKTIVIESGVTSIGDGAFYFCNGATSITIPASVTSIGDAAFSSCDGLTTVTFDGTSTLTTIGEYAFQDCSNLTSITIPSSVTTIGGDAFKGSGLTSITIPASVESIAWGVFAGCTNLATMTVDAGNPKYDSRNSCNAIIETSTNTLIAGCKNTIIPDDVTTIDFYAFEDCTGLTSIEIPASVTEIHDKAFAGCSNLATMTVDAGNPKYDSRNSCNAIIETSSNTLIAGCKNSTIPSSVTTIGGHAFFNCTGLTSIEIPSSVTSIGIEAFAGCSGLTSVTVYAPSCTLGNNAFRDCENLANIYVFSDKVESYQAAENWSDYASKITDIPYLNGNCGVTDHESDVRWVLTGEDPYTLTIMKVGSTGDMKDYDDPDDQPWKDYRSSITKVVIGSGVTHIGNNAFDGVDDAKFSAFVTKDNFYSFFDNSGILLDNVTFEELIFQGEFSGSDIVDNIFLDRSITITGDNAVLNDIGFFIAADDVTLQNMTLVATSFLGNLIDIAGEKAVIKNMNISYNRESGKAVAINVAGYDVNILNNSIYFESHTTTDEDLVTVINLDNVEDVNVEGNTIVASMPGLSVYNYDFDYFMMGLCNVNPVRVYESNSVKLTNNKIDVTVNSYAESYPVVQALYIVGSEDIHVEGNDFKMVDEITPEETPIYLYAVECGYSEGIEFNKNNFDISTKGGQSGYGSVYVLQVATTEATFIGNNITCQSNGSSLGICSPSGYGPAKDLVIQENVINVTGLVTGSNDFALISGIEIQTGYATISNNTIYVQNKGGYDDTYPVSGISAAQYGASTLSFDIQNNEVYVPDGKYAVDIRYAPQATVTENALCAHELFGDDAVYIKEGSGNTVENNILGYAMPKTGERTYNIPANVSSFKVYDDGGKGRIYSPGCDGTLTLTAPEGYRLQLSGNITTEKDVDYLSVYDGSSNLADVLINQVSSSASGELTAIPTVTSTGQSITFYFHSDNSDSDNSEFDGLDLTVTLVYTIDETTQNGGVVPDNVTTTTLTYTRTIPNSGDAWTVCLPYEPPTGDDLKYYTLESVSGTTLNFTEVTSPQAQTPYLVVASSDASVGTSAATVVNFSAEVQNPEAVDGYQFKGTLRGLDHDASVGKYILQSNNKWGIVLAEKTSVYIPPFRAYIESTSDARSLDSNLNDGTTGVDTIRTIDADGTEQWFDLSGRHIDKPTKKGLYIHNGKKEIVK